MTSTTYVPGTLEQDQKKLIYSLQQLGPKLDTINSAYVTTIAGNSGAFTLNSTSGITNSTNDIKLQQATSSQFGAIKVDGTSIVASSGVISLNASQIHASLGADVAMNVTANYFDGPSIAQGTSGTWWVSGTVSLVDTAGAADFYAKLWDGTTVIASATANTFGLNQLTSISLSGYITSPAANLKISVRDITSTSGKILFNQTGTSKDSTISAFRIA